MSSSHTSVQVLQVFFSVNINDPNLNFYIPDLQIFLCADLWKDTATLHAAYHDSEGVTQDFIKNGMQHALRTLGCEAAGDASKWDYEVSSVPGTRAAAVLKPGSDINSGQERYAAWREPITEAKCRAETPLARCQPWCVRGHVLDLKMTACESHFYPERDVARPSSSVQQACLAGPEPAKLVLCLCCMCGSNTFAGRSPPRSRFLDPK